jgi:cell division protein FtsL
MSQDNKNNDHDLNELYNRLKNMGRAKVDKTLAYLDKGSPKLNWLYITLAVAIIFLLVGLIMVLTPDDDTPTEWAAPEELNLQISDMETRISELESKVSELENQ